MASSQSRAASYIADEVERVEEDQEQYKTTWEASISSLGQLEDVDSL